MKIVKLESGGKTTDISQIVCKVTWSGEIKQVARRLDFTVASSPSDAFLPKIDLPLGTTIIMYGDTGRELFRGFVVNRSKSSSSAEMMYTCYDGAFYLLKNDGAYNFKSSATPEAMTSKICADFGIPVGSIAKTGVPVGGVFIGDNLYTIIIKGYSKASYSNGKKYLPIMSKGALNVVEKGSLIAGIILDDGTNISESTYSESIEDMVNTVRIVDDKGNTQNTISNSADAKAYGRLQKVMQFDDNVINKVELAKAALVGVDRTGEIDAIGDDKCITGFAVVVHDKYTGLYGNFYIDADSHTWEDGTHLMNLTLNFQNIMDLQEVQEKSLSSASSDVAWNFDWLVGQDTTTVPRSRNVSGHEAGD